MCTLYIDIASTVFISSEANVYMALVSITLVTHSFLASNNFGIGIDVRSFRSLMSLELEMFILSWFENLITRTSKILTDSFAHFIHLKRARAPLLRW